MKRKVPGRLAGVLLCVVVQLLVWPARGQNVQGSGEEPVGGSLEFIDLDGGEDSHPASQEEPSPGPAPKQGGPREQTLAPKKGESVPGNETLDGMPESTKEAAPAGPGHDAGLAGKAATGREGEGPARAVAGGAAPGAAADKGRGSGREVDSKKLLQSDSPEKYLEHHEEIDKDLIRIYRGYYRKP